jgi:hypothetical protein
MFKKARTHLPEYKRNIPYWGLIWIKSMCVGEGSRCSQDKIKKFTYLNINLNLNFWPVTWVYPMIFIFVLILSSQEQDSCWGEDYKSSL